MNGNDSIMIVDDERVVRDSLAKWFQEDGYDVGTADSAAGALKQLQARAWDVILLDIRMPGVDGMELQQRINEILPGTTIIFITAHATIDTAVQALKRGAFDYVTKPVDPDYLSHIVQNAIKQRALLTENKKLKERMTEIAHADEIVGQSPQMQKIFEMVETVAKTDTTVMIRGESGTGKELIARAIHAGSGRKFFPIVTVNCGGLAEGLLESELFGHERGAFTGAQYRRKGKLELSDGGTLFLDEVGNVSPKTQMDLLRVLETKQFSRVGGNELLHTDFRIICATNRNLEKAVADGLFREDLYYRLNVFSIFIPPLRERRSDIELLAKHFLCKYAAMMNKAMQSFAPDAMAAIAAYSWPGNVRELENAVERAMVVGEPPSIHARDLPMRVAERPNGPALGSLAAMEKVHILQTLEEHKWNISRSADILDIDRVTLYNKIEKYGLKRP